MKGNVADPAERRLNFFLFIGFLVSSTFYFLWEGDLSTGRYPESSHLYFSSVHSFVCLEAQKKPPPLCKQSSLHVSWDVSFSFSVGIKKSRVTSAHPSPTDVTASSFVFLAARRKLSTSHLHSVLIFFPLSTHLPFYFFALFFICLSPSKAFPLQSKPGRNSHSSNRYVCVVLAW